MNSLRILFTVLFIAMGTCSIAMFSVAEKVTELHYESNHYNQQLYLFTRLSQELKDSSDHLSKFARAYASDGNPRWEKLFNRVLDMRNGRLPLPRGNEYEYWDLTVVDLDQQAMIPKSGTSQSLLDRLRASGIMPVEFLELKNALSLSDGLVSLERDAFMAIKGFKRDSSGVFIDTGSPDLAFARNLLYSDLYFTEKANIMTAIGQARQAIVTRIDNKITLVDQSVGQYETIEFTLVIILLFVIATSFILLWRTYIAPLSQLLKTVVTQVNQENYAFTINQKAHGELKEFINSLNIVFHHIAEQLKQNTLVKDFNIVMRNNQSTEKLCQEVTRFVLHQFPIEMVGMYIYQDGVLKRVAGAGYGDQAVSEISDPSTTQLSVLLSDKAYTMRGLAGSYTISMNGGQLSYNELYYLPMHVNGQPVALLELGTIHELSAQQYQWLLHMLDDLSVSIQLSQNVEKQRHAEQKVLQQSQLNQEILNATPNPMYCLSAEGKYLTINAKFVDLTGLPSSEIVGKTPSDIFDQKTAEIFSKVHDSLQGSKSNQDFEISIVDSINEKRDMLVYEASFYDEGKSLSGIVGIFIDLTERKRTEEALREAKEVADSMSQAKGDFLANMSHEIRTPMNAILGMAHLALNTELNETQHKYVSRINESAKNLLGIINDILDFSKIETGKLSIEHIDFSLEEVLDNLTSAVSLRASEKGLEFALDIDQKIPIGLIGDPLRLGQVLVNLTGNAIKFTNSGEVIVAAKLEKQTDSGVNIHFSVKDTGIGIPQDKMETLFSAFSQADSSITRKYGGTGLGLSISKQLVELMGGDIQLSSTENKGSIFEFSIHCGLQTAKMRNISEPINGLVGKRALVVDDNDSARHILVTLLKAMHIDAQSVSNGAEALDELKYNSYDMIFVDWNMPGMNGIDLLHKVNKIDDIGNLKRFLVTAYGREISLNDENSLLADALIIKPLNPSTLLDSIVNCLGIEYINKHHQISKKIKKPRFNGQSILIVEDNEINQEVVLGLLDDLNVKTAVAENGQIAIEMLSKKTWDLVFMDMQMPVLDGVSATKRIRQQPQWKSLPIVAMTANAMQSDIEECLNAGMDNHIAKPIDINKLYAVLVKILGHPQQEVIEEIIESSTDTSKESKCEAQKELPILNGIDLPTAISRIGGDAHRYLDILQRFINGQGKEFENVKRLFIQQQWEDAIRLSHTVKGTAANLGIERIARLTGDIERELDKQQSLDESKVDDVIGQCEQLSQQLQLWFNTHPQPERAEQTVNITESYTALIESVENYNMDALDIIHQIKNTDLWTEEQKETLFSSLENFDFDLAKSLLERYPKPKSLD